MPRAQLRLFISPSCPAFKSWDHNLVLSKGPLEGQKKQPKLLARVSVLLCNIDTVTLDTLTLAPQ